MRTAVKKAALGRFNGDSNKLKAAISKKKPQVRNDCRTYSKRLCMSSSSL